jgi:hypothetical protein
MVMNRRRVSGKGRARRIQLTENSQMRVVLVAYIHRMREVAERKGRKKRYICIYAYTYVGQESNRREERPQIAYDLVR